ncbi:MAG: RNase adapter RapZ, partial [Thermicanus sp.]|nr:RNase adapter RapZ [Thermicanus sp.]
EVAQYVLKWTETQQFLQRLTDFLRFLLPHYKREGKGQLVVGIGCTGGKHRSVTIAEALKNAFEGEYPVRTMHRDMDKDN